MPLNKAAKLLQFKRNPGLAFFQESEAIKQQLEVLVRVLIAQELKNLKQEITNQTQQALSQIEAKQTDVSTLKIAEQVSKSIIGNFKGVKGDGGNKGERGDSITGLQGIRGLQGFVGKTGTIGKTGLTGISGRDGIDGITGKAGKDGQATIFPKEELEEFKQELLDLIQSKIKQLRKLGSQQISGGGFDESRRYVVDEAPDGVKAAAQLTFTLANIPATGTLTLYLNGQRLEQGVGSDYTLSGLTISFVSGREPTKSNENLRADYIKQNRR